LIAINSFAQKNIDGLIQAEKNFAAYSVAHGIKDAFLKFADSTGIIFDKGMPLNAIEIWNKREKRPGKLDWQPEYVEIAASNDFGYTTGPYTFTLNDSVAARGEYVTVWQINKNDEWKFLLDLGVNNTPKILALGLEKITEKKFSGDASTDEMLKAEQDFITYLKNDKEAAYKKYLSGKSILKRNGHYSVTSKKFQKKIIMDDPQDSEFRILGSGIAPSGDLGYVFGTISVGVKQEGYQRIWRHEKDGWKIALEVLRY
jgi:ketosteroid isomerase-like protein